MSVVTLFRLMCDAPYCTASEIADSIAAVPEGWVAVESTSHITPGTPSVRYKKRSGRPIYMDFRAGGWTLLLCPKHHHTFIGHTPRSIGGESGRDGVRVSVGCSCGAALGEPLDVILRGDGPGRLPHRVWWQHLPAELRWYATRETAPTGGAA